MDDAERAEQLAEQAAARDRLETAMANVAACWAVLADAYRGMCRSMAEADAALQALPPVEDA